MKKVILCSFLLLFLAACTQAAQPISPTPTMVQATQTAEAPTPEPTPPPTEASTQDEPTAEPTLSPAETATPEPEVATEKIEDEEVSIDQFASAINIPQQLKLASTDPIIRREDGNRYLNGGAVIYHNEQFHMFSNFFNSWPGETVTYYYTSPDGEQWSRAVEQPVFTVEDVPLHGRGALALTGLVTDDGQWVLYYHTFTSGSQPGYIGRATATNPLGPWTFDPEPALTPGSEGEWDDLHVMRANVLPLPEDNGYVMYYAGTTSGRQSSIGMATSDDGITWEKFDDPTTSERPYAESDPIMEPMLDWEGKWLGRPEVVFTDDGWVMLYEGDQGNKTGVALSEDGTNFSRYVRNPILTRENMVEGFTFFQGAFFHHDDRYSYLIEAGNGAIGTDIFLYTLDGSLKRIPGPAPEPQFTLGSHYGGRPAGDWDRDTWEIFLDAHPDVNADIDRTDYYHSFINREIHTQLNHGLHPDVYHAALGGSLYAYAEQGIIADITDLWEEQGWDEFFPASIKEMSSVNGRQYFVPQAIQWNGLFYRTDVMAAAEVEPPTTWDELIAACDKLNAAGIVPFAMTASTAWPPPMGFWFTHINQRLNGPEFHEQLMRGQISYTDPRVREVFNYYGQLFEHNCFAENSTRQQYGQAITQFESGDAAMYAHGEWLFEFIDEDTKSKTDFIRFPMINPDVTHGELVPMYGAFMLADTEFPELAREYLTHVADIDSQQSLVDDIQRLPSHLQADRTNLHPLYEKGLQMVEEAEILTQLIGANTAPPVATTFLEGIGRFWQDPESIDQWLNTTEKIRQDIYGDIPTDSES